MDVSYVADTYPSFSIYSKCGELVVRHDDTGEIIGSVPSEITISAKTDSSDVVSLVEHMLPGSVLGIDHDRGEIIVCCHVR